jgi:hypothetical protein
MTWANSDTRVGNQFFQKRNNCIFMIVEAGKEIIYLKDEEELEAAIEKARIENKELFKKEQKNTKRCAEKNLTLI